MLKYDNPAMMARITPFAIYIAFLAVRPIISSGLQRIGLDGNWSYAIMLIPVVLSLIWFRRHSHELLLPPRLPMNGWLRAFGVGLLVFVLWVLPYPEWAKQGGTVAGFIPLQSDGSLNLPLVIIRLTGAALVVPIMEELFWRSFILRWIDRSDFLSQDPALVSHKAFWLVAVLFAVEHDLWLAGLFAGIAYNWLYKVERNLWAPVFAHALTNASLGFWVLSRGAWQYW